MYLVSNLTADLRSTVTVPLAGCLVQNLRWPNSVPVAVLPPLGILWLLGFLAGSVLLLHSKPHCPLGIHDTLLGHC